MEEQQNDPYPAHLNPFADGDDGLNPFGDDDKTVNPYSSEENGVKSCNKAREPDTITSHVTQPVSQTKSGSFSKSFSTADFNAAKVKCEKRAESGRMSLHGSKSLMNLTENPFAIPLDLKASTLRHKKRKAPLPPQPTDFVQVVTVVAVTTTTKEDATDAPVKPTRRLSQIKRSAEVDEKPLLSDTEDE